MKKKDCAHKLTKLVGERECSAQSYCCEGESDGHFCSREHRYALLEVCSQCGRELNRGEWVTSLDDLINAVVEDCS